MKVFADILRIGSQTESVNDEDACRTAPATPALSNRLYYNSFGDSKSKGHQNHITGTRVTTILLNVVIFPIG